MDIHHWQINGLGISPFRVVGAYSLPSKDLAEQNPEAYMNAFRDMPKGFSCGTCAVCGAALMNNFLIESTDGHKFSVGCECVLKAGDQGMTTTIKEIERMKRAEKAEVKRQEKRETFMREKNLRDQAERDRNGGMTDAEIKQAEIDKKRLIRVRLLSPLAAALSDDRGGFRDSVASDLRDGRMPNGRGLDIMLDILCKQAGRVGGKQHQEEYERLCDLVESVETGTCYNNRS